MFAEILEVTAVLTPMDVVRGFVGVVVIVIISTLVIAHRKQPPGPPIAPVG